MLSVSTYEEVNKTTTNDSSISVGDTTITLTSGTGFNVGDIINFGETGGHEYRITAVDTNDITFVRHPSGTGGLHNALGGGTQVRRRWRYYRSVDRAFRNITLRFCKIRIR